MKKLFICCFLLSFIFSAVYSQDQSKIPYGNNPQAGKFYDIRGFKMYCEIYGSGKPLLLIHGNGGSIANWSKQISFFTQRYMVIIADSRAQGKSADASDSLSYEMMADDLAVLLDTLKVDSARVIGWSDGGINGLLMAIRHPRKVSKLAITGANLEPDTSAVFQEVRDMVQPFYSRLKNNNNKNAREKNQWKLIRLLLDEPHIALSEIQKIKCPTLVIGGDHDVIKEEHTMLIYKNIPQAYLWIVPDSGHSIPIVYETEFNRAVNEFFRKPWRKIEKQDRFN
jgi:pimeloyl-ACP methyl ester carboxylesterase